MFMQNSFILIIADRVFFILNIKLIRIFMAVSLLVLFYGFSFPLNRPVFKTCRSTLKVIS